MPATRLLIGFLSGRPPQGRRISLTATACFILSLLLNSLAITAGFAANTGKGGLVVEICASGHIEQVVLEADSPTPSYPQHDCADWCCALCVSAVPPEADGGRAGLDLAARALRTITMPATILPAGRLQSRSGNPRAPPLFS